ncbi:hypothetical protein BLSTO_00445 [Blastocystis sp. subtype 1]
MSNYKAVLTIHRREDTTVEKNGLRVKEDNATVEYVENDQINTEFTFNSVFSDPKDRKQSLDDLVTEWVNDLLRGESQLIAVVGKEESGSQYLLKGTSLNPGIVPLIEKRIASLCADSTLTAKFSYLRYTNDSFWDILSANRTAVSLGKPEGSDSFGSYKSISILSPQSIGSIQSTINASLHQTYNEFFSTPYHSLWLFTSHLRSSPKAASIHLAIVNFSIDNESDASLLSFLASLRGTPSTGVFAPLLPSFPARSLLLCTDSQPSPAKLALLQAAALTTTQVTQVTTQPTSLATDKVSVKREAARRRKVAEESARLPIPVLDEVNDIAMELISSGSDSYVESSSDEPEPVFETPKKTHKRVVQRSTLSGKVYGSAAFSPASRNKIYQNESRLSLLLNGTPVLSPCSRITKAKQLIVQGREREAESKLEEALREYEEAAVYLPDNERLKEKIEDVKNRVQANRAVAEDVGADRSEKKVLQVLNYAGLSGLVKLKRIGESKATKILHERENGLFTSIEDLSRIGMNPNAIQRFKSENCA